MAAGDYVPYYLVLASGIVQFAHTLYVRHVRLRDEKEVREREELAEKEKLWKELITSQVERHRDIFIELRGPIKRQLGVDIKVDKMAWRSFDD